LRIKWPIKGVTVRIPRGFWVTLLAALLGAGPVLLNPEFPRDAPAHAFGIEYAWRVLMGLASHNLCPYWYMGFPYTACYCFLPYYLLSPLTRVLSPPYAFAVGLVLAAWLFCLGVYALARRLGLGEWDPWVVLLAAAGMCFEWSLGGILPMTFSLAFGLLAMALRDQRILAPVLLALSLYSHPIGGALSCLVMVVWGLVEGRPRDLKSVAVAGLLAAPQYAFLAYYAHWFSPLIDVPRSPLELLAPGLYSPGVLLLALGLMGVLWASLEQPGWRVTVLVCVGLAWAVGLAMWWSGAWRLLPLGRNLLLDRLTCAFTAPMLAISAGFVLRYGGRWARILAIPALLTLAAPWLILGLTPTLVVPGSASAWKWVASHRPADLLTRAEPGPFFRAWSEWYGAAWNCVRVGPRFTGNFAQGDPYFHALAERAEWELFWWYDPEFVRTVCQLANVKYLVTALPSAVRAGERAGLHPAYRSGMVTVLENPRTSAADLVDPIAVYDPNVSTRTAVRDYTTALNLIPRDGYRYAFAVVRNPRYLWAFRKVLIRPASPNDVALALNLASSGKRVLLVLPHGNESVASTVSQVLKVNIQVTRLRLRPSYPDVRDQLRLWMKLVGRRLLINPLLVAPRYRPIKPRPLPEPYLVDGKWFKDVRVGKGTVRVCGVDLPVVAVRMHPTLLNARPRTPPLPGPSERRLFTSVLSGFGCTPHPVRVQALRMEDITVSTGKRAWVLVKVKHFPAWRVQGGKAFPGPGGTTVVMTRGKAARLLFQFPWELETGGLAGLLAGTVCLMLRGLRRGSTRGTSFSRS